MDSKMILVSMALILCGVFSVHIISKLIVKDSDTEVKIRKKKGRRFSQLRDFSEANVIKNRLDEYLSDKMEYEKRKKNETLLKQSGLSITMVDIHLMGVILGIVLAIIAMLSLNNKLAAVALFGVGFIIPKNIVVLIRNKRVAKLDNQVCMFIRMTVKRYYVTNNFIQSMEDSLKDFDGQQPITGELKAALAEIELGTPAVDALESMAQRTSNVYMKLFANNYRAAVSIGTYEMNEKLLDSVVEKFDKDIKLRSKMKREISQPVLEGLLMMTIVPATFIMQTYNDPEYFKFMKNEPLGQMAMAGAIVLIGASIWLLVNKVAAPIIEEED